MKVKQLIETLLKDLDPKADVEVVIRKGSDEATKDKKELFQAGYEDGKFVLDIVEWL